MRKILILGSLLSGSTAFAAHSTYNCEYLTTSYQVSIDQSKAWMKVKEGTLEKGYTRVIEGYATVERQQGGRVFSYYIPSSPHHAVISDFELLTEKDNATSQLKATLHFSYRGYDEQLHTHNASCEKA